jgi:hypothetical protein
MGRRGYVAFGADIPALVCWEASLSKCSGADLGRKWERLPPPSVREAAV